jgi:UDP-N-acetylmuramoylalanine--D-glutamate ligase
MTLAELEKRSIVILGFGAEGQATYAFLRKRWPAKPLSIADRRTMSEFPEDVASRLKSDSALSLSLGARYVDALDPYSCEVIIKTPGIPASMDGIVRALKGGCVLTSHSQIFLSNYPRGRVIGVTGTKGKSTTASLIHHILKGAGLAAELVGNIGEPPLTLMDEAPAGTFFVHEFSSHQLAEIQTSPHIAVLLNIVPEHLDYYANFDAYVSAKENITRFQNADDILVFNAGYPIPTAIAGRSKAILKPFSINDPIEGIEVSEIPLPGKFNVQNVMAAVSVASVCGVQRESIRNAVLSFHALPHRLELIGTYKGITFYDDSIATVPAATLAALEALGQNVQTLLLGGHERNLEFTELGAQLPENIKTVILFPRTGTRIWQSIDSLKMQRCRPRSLARDMNKQ